MYHYLFLIFLLGWLSLPERILAQTKQKPLKVTLIQAQLAWGNVDANLDAFGKRIEQCPDCDLIVFPELFTSGCEMKKRDAQEKADTKDIVSQQYLNIIEKMQQWARQTNALIVGSTIYKEDNLYFNRLLAVYPDGTYQIYDKHNCFKKGSFSPGKERLIFSWKGFRFSPYICYDLRFPEWSKNQNEYDIAIYIANWPESRHNDWVNLLEERATENQVHVIAVNCVGTDPAGITYRGGSCLLNPDGNVIVRCQDYKEEIQTSQIVEK